MQGRYVPVCSVLLCIWPGKGLHAEFNSVSCVCYAAGIL